MGTWYDPLVSDHERQVIIGLLWKIRIIEMKNSAKRKRERDCKQYIFFLGAYIGILADTGACLLIFIGRA